MNIHKLLLATIAANLLFLGALNAASFDCKKAGNFIEHSICNDAELSKLDDDLAIAYKSSMKSHADKNQLKSEQLEWMKKERNVCKDVECLKKSYSNRIAALKSNGNSKSQSSIEGVYENGGASILIRPDLTFNYDEVNPRSTNMCMIDEKFTKKGEILVWQSDESDCKIEIIQVAKNKITLTKSSINKEDDGCNYYCGMNMSIEEGEYTKRVKK